MKPRFQLVPSEKRDMMQPDITLIQTAVVTPHFNRIRTSSVAGSPADAGRHTALGAKAKEQTHIDNCKSIKITLHLSCDLY